MRLPLGSITNYDAPGENASPPRLLLALGHPAAIADATLDLFRALVDGALSARDRKLATLAIAAELRNAYEWGHHRASALTMDISEDDLESIKVGDHARLVPRDRVVVELAKAVEGGRVTDELWARASEVFATEELAQVTVLASYYGMLARIQSALEVEQDDGFSSTF